MTDLKPGNRITASPQLRDSGNAAIIGQAIDAVGWPAMTFIRVMRAVWNGPFFIGKLERPIQWSEVGLKVLETGWRASILGFLAFLLIGAGYLISEEIKDAEQSRLYAPGGPLSSQKVEFTIKHSLSDCGPDKPLLLSVTNLTQHDLLSYSWRISAFVEGRSTDITAYDQTALGWSDYIVGPRARAFLCIPIPQSVVPRMAAERISFSVLDMTR